LGRRDRGIDRGNATVTPPVVVPGTCAWYCLGLMLVTIAKQSVGYFKFQFKLRERSAGF